MTYSEALEVLNTRQKLWDSYYEKCGRPSFDEYENCILNSPKDIFNYNVISRSGGLFITASNSIGIYEYPVGLLAWGNEIPRESYVSDDILSEDIWEVISRKETYDW